MFDERYFFEAVTDLIADTRQVRVRRPRENLLQQTRAFIIDWGPSDSVRGVGPQAIGPSLWHHTRDAGGVAHEQLNALERRPAPCSFGWDGPSGSSSPLLSPLEVKLLLLDALPVPEGRAGVAVSRGSRGTGGAALTQKTARAVEGCPPALGRGGCIFDGSRSV